MKKTDIGVVAFVYAVALFFLSMTLKLPKPAQAYPLAVYHCAAAGIDHALCCTDGHRSKEKRRGERNGRF